MRWIAAVGLFFYCIAMAQASGLVMARSRLPVDQTLSVLRDLLEDQGYKISRIQDIAETKDEESAAADQYKLVYFGNKNELDQLIDRYPVFAAYLPWKLTVFAERNHTLVISIHPQEMKQLFPQARTEPAIQRLEQSLKATFTALRKSR